MTGSQGPVAEPQYIAEQLRQYRNHLELMFAPASSETA